MKGRIFFVLCCWLLSGCGYTFYNLNKMVGRVYVAAVKNELKIDSDYSSLSDLDKYYPHIEEELQHRLIDKFLKNGMIKSDSQDNSDLAIIPTLIDYKKIAVSYSEGDRVLRWRISVGLNVKLVMGEKNWDKTFWGQAILDKNGSEAEAIASAIDDLTRKVFDFIVTHQK